MPLGGERLGIDHRSKVERPHACAEPPNGPLGIGLGAEGDSQDVFGSDPNRDPNLRLPFTEARGVALEYSREVLSGLPLHLVHDVDVAPCCVSRGHERAYVKGDIPVARKDHGSGQAGCHAPLGTERERDVRIE